MKTLLLGLSVVCLVTLCGGCGNVFLSASSQPGFSTTSGVVSIVQLSGGFCGDQGSRLPMNQTVRADFVPGQSCFSILVVVLI